MSDDDLLSVSRFARLAGLTVHAVRHYDAVGVLKPTQVDARTGYRRYARGQVATARMVMDLRWLDLPIHQVRQILADPDAPTTHALLRAHAERLARQRRHLDRQIARCATHAIQGVDMPTTSTTVAPVQLKIGVRDLAQARTFYQRAFGLVETVIRHTDDADHVGYQFGTYGRPGFFLVVLHGPEAFDHPARSTFGLTVPDLDQAHQQALDAGATEAVAPDTPHGMPRTSAVTDPDGNWIWLYQG